MVLRGVLRPSLLSMLSSVVLLSQFEAKPLRAAEAESEASASEGAAADGAYWELGIGLSGISFPDYVGSDERRYWPLPFPYVLYESKRVTVDQGTLSGALWLTERLHLDISAGGALPVDSHNNKARKGMRDLDAVGEVGPSLKYEFYHSDSGRHRLTADLPIRSAIAVSLDGVRYVGLISSPNVEYRLREPADDGRWTFSVSTGPLFADDRYDNYFYRVRSHEATADRPAYRADGGYGGWRLSGGFSRRWKQFWFGGFLRYINLNGAVFENSPLVKTDSYLIGGVGAAWVFATSQSDNESDTLR
jgi:outer membrane protein